MGRPRSYRGASEERVPDADVGQASRADQQVGFPDHGEGLSKRQQVRAGREED